MEGEEVEIESAWKHHYDLPLYYGNKMSLSQCDTHTFIDYYCGVYNQCSTGSSQVTSTTFIFSAELPTGLAFSEILQPSWP